MIINFRDLGSSGGGSDPRLTTSAFTSVDYVASAKTIYFKNLNGSVVGSIDATDFVVDGMVQDVYISGNTLVIEFNTESGKQDINVDLSDIFDPDNYWTSAQTQSAIENATEGFVNSGEVETQITSKGYITGYTETDPVFTGSPAYGITSQNINDWDSKLDASALTPYYTSAQTQSAITEAFASAKTYTDTQISGATSDFVTSGDVATQISAATVHMVESEDNSVVNIIRISQADYDALVSKDPYTLYVIVITPTYIGEWEDVLGDHTQYHFTILDDTSSLWNDVKIGTIHCWYLPEGQGSVSVVEGDVDIYLNYTQSSWHLRFKDNSTFDDTIELYDSVGLYESNISVVEVSDPNDANWKPLGFEMNNAIIYFNGSGSPISLVTINPVEE